MKYLSNYTQEAQTELFEEKGVIFAFSNEQFEEQKKEWVVYASPWMWMYCPKWELNNILTALDNIQEEWIKKDIAENGIEWIIKRELNNYECYYTGDTSDAVAFLKQYWISEEQVDKLFYHKER